MKYRPISSHFRIFFHFLNFLNCFFELFWVTRDHFAHPDSMGGVPPMKSLNSIGIWTFWDWVCILKFGFCSVFKSLACEEMKGTTNLAVVDLSPYGFVFKEFSLQALILNEFLGFVFFCNLCYNSFCRLQKSFCTTGFHGVLVQISTIPAWISWWGAPPKK